MGSVPPLFTFGTATTNRIYSVVDDEGTGIVIRRDVQGGKAQFFSAETDSSGASEWTLIEFTLPEGIAEESLDPDQPFYLGYSKFASNPIIYLYESNSDDDFYSIQYANFYDYQLEKFANDDDFEACTSFLAQDQLIALCDTEYNYYLGEPQQPLFEYTNPDEEMNRIVVELGITGGLHAVPVALLNPLPGQSDPVRIRWWSHGNETYFENPTTQPEGIVCFDDYIVWRSGDSIGWIDVETTGTPVTEFDSIPTQGHTVVIAKSGPLFQTGHVWYGTDDGAIYHLDILQKSSRKVLDVKNSLGSSSSRISQLHADNYFLFVLLDNGNGGAWKITDMK